MAVVRPPMKDLESSKGYVPPSKRTGGGRSLSSRFANLSDNPSGSSRFSSGYKGDRHTPGAGSRYDRDRGDDRESNSRFGNSFRSSRFDRDRGGDRQSESSSRFGGDRQSSSRFGDRNSSRFDRDRDRDRDGDRNDRSNRPPPEPRNNRWAT